MRAKWIGLLMIGALALLLVGCSGDGATTALADSAVAAADHEADGHDDEAATDADHEAEGHEDVVVTSTLADEAVDLVIDLTLTNFAYEPRLIVANVGDLIRLHVENDTYGANVPHDFTIEKIDAEMQIVALTGSGEHAHSEEMEMADLHFALTEAGVGEVYVRVHEPGDYIFFCTVPGHRALGMEGVLRVN